MGILKNVSAVAITAVALAAAAATMSDSASAKVVKPGQGSPPPRVVSCSPGTGCRVTPVKHPFTPRFRITFGGHPPVYHPGHWHEHRHVWGFGFRRFTTVGYASDICAHKWRTRYVPHFGLERELVRVCEVI
jgi:hypothetical protein